MIDELFKQIASLLPKPEEGIYEDTFFTNSDNTEILSTSRNEVETLANLFDQISGNGVAVTGCYDAKEDRRNDEVDAYTGLFYVSIS